MDFGPDFRDFRLGLKVFNPYAWDFTSDFKDLRDFMSDFKVSKPDARDFTDYRDFRVLMDFRLDCRDSRSDFRTFVPRIPEVVGP